MFSTVASLSPNKVTASGHLVPLITPELFLFAIIRTEGISMGQRLIEAGVRLDELKAEATRHF